MVGGDALAHPRLDGREVVGRQRPRQLEVVVEAVVDDRTDAELRAREQVQHGLGHDVGGGVAHRVELAGGAGVQQLVGRPALGRVEQRLVRRLAARQLFGLAHGVRLLRIAKPLVHRQDERFTPAVPPAFAGPARADALVVALTGDSRAGSPAAHGWCRRGDRRRASSPVPALCWSAPRGASRSTLIFELWWATLDSNQ